MCKKIIIVDYGLGNLNSIKNMLKHIGYNSEISDETQKVSEADNIILPGVGRFGAGMQGILDKNLLGILNKKALKDQIPILGICLGMQLLTKGSEEDNVKGLGWIDAYTYRFSVNDAYKVPHMGWNTVEVVNDNPLIKDKEEYNKFYFVHSYFVKTKKDEETILETEYGIRFASGIKKGNIMGVQFHPEKSHRYGMALLKNFMEM